MLENEIIGIFTREMVLVVWNLVKNLFEQPKAEKEERQKKLQDDVIIDTSNLSLEEVGEVLGRLTRDPSVDMAKVKIKEPDKTKDELDFPKYFELYENARDHEKNGDTAKALDLYINILSNFEPSGTSYYERPAIILEKQKRYEEALKICNLALSNPNRFNIPTLKAVKKSFIKRKERLLKKIEDNKK